MERSALLAKLRETARDLRTYLGSDTSKWVTGIATNAETDTSGEKKLDDYIYELMCGFAIVIMLEKRASGLRLMAAPGATERKYRFPLKPGKKANFAFFRFEFEAITYDLCLGTAIAVRGGTEEHPDISLQRQKVGIGDGDRSVGAIEAIWDAKYHKKNKASKADIQQMSYWCSLMRAPPYKSKDLLDRLLREPFYVRAVITNADAPDPINKLLPLEQGFSVVGNFVGLNSTTTVVPPRSEHETFGSPAASKTIKK